MEEGERLGMVGAMPVSSMLTLVSFGRSPLIARKMKIMNTANRMIEIMIIAGTELDAVAGGLDPEPPVGHGIVVAFP